MRVGRGRLFLVDAGHVVVAERVLATFEPHFASLALERQLAEAGLAAVPDVERRLLLFGRRLRPVPARVGQARRDDQKRTVNDQWFHLPPPVRARRRTKTP